MVEVDHFTELSGHLLAAGQVRSAPVYNITLEQVAFGEGLLLDRTTGRPVYAVVKNGWPVRRRLTVLLSAVGEI